MKKRLSALLLMLICLSVFMTACNGKKKDSISQKTAAVSDNEPVTKESESDEETYANGTVTVAVVGTPQDEILKQTAALLKKEGWKLDIKEYTDYVTPNEAVENGECDASYYEHYEYLKIYNEKNSKHLVSAGEIHFEPLGIYAGNKKKLGELSNGDRIIIPSDDVKRARALMLLEDKGFITLAEGVGLTAISSDITVNPKNLEIVEMDSSEITGALSNAAFGIMDGNYALDAGFNPARDALCFEAVSSEAAKSYGTLLVIKEGNEQNKGVMALLQALKSEEIKKYITNNYHGSVLPF